MNKMFTVWASLAALIVAAPIGKAHATDTPKFADILDSNFESAKGRADFRVAHSCPNDGRCQTVASAKRPDNTGRDIFIQYDGEAQRIWCFEKTEGVNTPSRRCQTADDSAPNGQRAWIEAYFPLTRLWSVIPSDPLDPVCRGRNLSQHDIDDAYVDCVVENKEAPARAKMEVEAKERAVADAAAAIAEKARIDAKAKADAEAAAVEAAAAKAKAEAEAKAQADADAKAKADAEAAQEKIEADAKAKIEAERPQIEAEAQAKVQAQIEADLRAKAEADALAKAQAKAQAVSDARAAAIAKAQIAAANAQVAAARARTAASADVVCSIYDSQGSVLSYSFNGGFDRGAMLEVGFTKNGAILQPAGAIQPVWTSERDNGRVVLRSTRDMGWLITVAPNSNALLMTPAGRVAGTGNCR
jgi:hypothetical protein